MDPLKNQTTAARADDARRWWMLATVVAAQFIYGCDAFIVNVAIPTIARELAATRRRSKPWSRCISSATPRW
jgi:hypothetical protein